jgi:hypothetical protein
MTVYIIRGGMVTAQTCVPAKGPPGEVVVGSAEEIAARQRVITAKGGAKQPAGMLLGKVGDTKNPHNHDLPSPRSEAGCQTEAAPRRITVMQFKTAHQSMVNHRQNGCVSRPAPIRLKTRARKKATSPLARHLGRISAAGSVYYDPRER